MARSVLRRPLWLVLVAIAAFAGCGSSSSPGFLGHAELISRADAICKHGNDQIVALQAPSAAGGSAGAIRLLDHLLAIANAEVTQLRRLAPPGSSQAAFGQYVHDNIHGLAIASRMRDALVARDVSGYHHALAQLSAVSGAADKLAYELRMAECAKTVEPKG